MLGRSGGCRILLDRRSRPFLFCRAEFRERIECISDLLAFTGILVNLGKPFHHHDVFGTNLLRQVVRLFDECFELVRVVFLHRLGYLRIELRKIAAFLLYLR
jgi:hypothetical protein